MKKSRRVIAILLALILTVSALGVVAYATDPEPYNRYVSVTPGSPTPKGTSSKPWGIDYLKEEAFAEAINAKVNDGSYSSVIINVVSSEDYDAPLIIKGVQGTEDVPVYVVGNYLSGGEGADSIITPAGGADYGIVVEDCSYVTVSNFRICNAVQTGALGGGINVKNSNNIYFQDISSYKPNNNYKKTMTKAVTVGDGVQTVVFENCSFTHTDKAFEIIKSAELEAKGVSGLTISGCTSEYCAAEALLIDGVDNVKVNDFSAVQSYYTEPEEGVETAEKVVVDFPAVVFKNMSGLTFSDSSISECAGPAFSLQNVTSSVVERLFSVNNASFMLNALGEDANVRIRFCISVNDNYKSSVASVTGASAVAFYNNTIYNIGDINFGSLSSSYIKNNIFQTVMLGKVTIGKNNTCGSNCYWNTTKPTGDKKSIMKNPQFYDAIPTLPGMESFILANNSVLLGAGEKVEEDMGTEDIFGNVLAGVSAINIGAYQGEGVTPLVEINQTSEVADFYGAYIKAKLDKAWDSFIGLFLTPEQRQSVSDFFSNSFAKVVDFFAGIIAKIINA